MLLDKRVQIIEAAKRAFEDKGYRVSMSDIAKRAGVAKQTLYNHFASKELLFAEVIISCGEQAHAVLNDAHLPLAEQLMAFSLAIRQVAMTEDGIASYRAMTAEAHRFPELAASFYQQGIGLLHQRLQQRLQQAHAQRELHCPDVSLAADMLFSMLTGFERSRLLLGVACGNDGEMTRVQPIVAAFLRAFAPLAASAHH